VNALQQARFQLLAISLLICGLGLAGSPSGLAQPATENPAEPPAPPSPIEPPAPDSNPAPAIPDVPAISVARPFAVGERLSYALFWLAIKAGQATLEVHESPPVEDRPALKLYSLAKSSKFLSTFYPVENRVESVIDAETPSPYRLIFHRREGKRRNTFDLTFHHAEGNVRSIKDGNEEVLPIPPGTQDILSCLYYVRALPSLIPGTSVVLNVHHDRKNYRLEVRVEGTEKVPSPWGEIEAVRVLAIMPFRGLFLNEGNIRVWLTNDVRRVPVMMKAKVIIGSITANLVDSAGMRPP
jgi:hypothetical protein